METGTVWTKTPDDPFPVIRLNEERWIEIVKNVAIDETPHLIVIDSLRGAHGGDENSSEVQTMLVQLAALARDVGCGVVFVHHLRKSREGESREVSLEKVRGSSAIGAMMRSIVAVDHPDPHDPTLRLRVVKSNLCALPEAVGVKIDQDGKVCPVSHVPVSPGRVTAVDAAAEFLSVALRKGPKPSVELFEEAEAQGISKQSLKRAKERMGCVAIKQGRSWSWSLSAY